MIDTYNNYQVNDAEHLKYAMQCTLRNLVQSKHSNLLEFAFSKFCKVHRVNVDYERKIITLVRVFVEGSLQQRLS